MGWKVDGASLGAAQTLLANLEGALATLVAWPDVDTRAIAPLIANLPSLAGTGTLLAANLRQFFAGYAIAAAASVQPFDETTSSRGPLPPADPTYGLAPFASYGSTLSSAMGSRATQNQVALVTLVETLAVMAMAKLSARTNFAAQDDADAARDQITGFIDGLAQDASDAGNADMYFRLQTLFQKVTADLTTRGLRLPGTVEVTLFASLPALALAQRYYADARRAGEIVSRNAAPHPLFMPNDIEVLTR